MVKIKKTGSTVKQIAYAQRVWGANGRTREEIALDIGYSQAVAKSPGQKIEKTLGFHNAMVKLASESNNLALAAMHEFKARGFKNFSDKDLIGSLNAIANAWSKFNRQEGGNKKEEKTNRLRTVVLQNVENQTILGGRKTKLKIQNQDKAIYNPDKLKGYYETPQEGEPIDLGF